MPIALSTPDDPNNPNNREIDAELAALEALRNALEPLSAAARHRVLCWATGRYGRHGDGEIRPLSAWTANP